MADSTVTPTWGSDGLTVSRYDATGVEIACYRLSKQFIGDDSELLAQGRHHENAQRKRRVNALPYVGDAWHLERLINCLLRKDLSPEDRQTLLEARTAWKSHAAQ